MGLKCESPLVCEFFSLVNPTVLHDVRLVEFMDAVPQIRRKGMYWGTVDMEDCL